MRRNTSEPIIMIRSTPQPKHAIVLRTTLNAGVLAGAAWVVDDDDACAGF